MIKKSFTMVELIFVILIVAIISVVVSPQFCGTGCNKDLMKAANQVLGHIRYTRHLAMIDNKFVPNTTLSTFSDSQTRIDDSRYWFNKRWQIAFHRYDYVYYSIFSDIPWYDGTNYDESFDGRPNIPAGDYSYKNIAIDPLTGKYLTGQDWSEKITNYKKELDLQKTYSIQLVKTDSLRGACGVGGTSTARILFDNMGRPYCDLTDRSLGEDNGYIKLIRAPVSIQLCMDKPCDNERSLSICIQPETGYSYISYNNSCS